MYSRSLICDILNFIDINLNRKLSISEFEKVFFFNRYYIMKLFKKELGISINKYINMLRIHNSLSEIKNTDFNFFRIAIDNGFYSLEYFSETFKKIMGVSPSVYRGFCYNNFDGSTDLKLLIVSNIVNLKILIEKKEKYLNNIKPGVLMTKNLTIFK